MNKFYYSDRFYSRQQNETSGEVFTDFKRIIQNTTCVNIFGHCGELVVLGPLCFKLITIVNCYLEAGLTCFVYCPKALYLFFFIVWHLL